MTIPAMYLSLKRRGEAPAKVLRRAPMASPHTENPEGLEGAEGAGGIGMHPEGESYPSDDDAAPENPEPYQFAGDDDEDEGVENVTDEVEVQVLVGRAEAAPGGEEEEDGWPTLDSGRAPAAGRPAAGHAGRNQATGGSPPHRHSRCGNYYLPPPAWSCSRRTKSKI